MKKIGVIVVLMVVLIAFAGRALIAWYGLSVTSWFRSPWHNQEVQGKTFSLHQIGWAYDVVPVNVLMHSLLAVWPFKYVVEEDHVHLQIF